MNILSKICALILLWFGNSIGYCQEEYNDLLLLFMDGENEKCIKKSFKYINKEKTSKAPLPYLYASMCFLELYKNEEKYNDKDALKESLKYATRYKRKDKFSLHWDTHLPFFEELRKYAKARATTFIDEKKWSRAMYYYKQISRFDSGDYSTWIMMGFVEAVSDNLEKSDEYFTNAKKALKEVETFNEEPADKKELYKSAMLNYSDWLVEKGRSDMARSILHELQLQIGETKEIIERKLSIEK